MPESGGDVSAQNPEAALASQRLAAVHQALEKGLPRIVKAQKLVSQESMSLVSHFLEEAETHFTSEERTSLEAAKVPWKAPSPYPPSSSMSFQSQMDAQSVQLRLKSMNNALRDQTRRLRRSRRVLRSNTMELIYHLLKTVERQPYMGNVSRSKAAGDFQTRDLFAVKLNSQIVGFSLHAKQQMMGLGGEMWRSEKSKKILFGLLHTYDRFFATNRLRMDHVNVATMFMKIMQNAAISGWSTDILPSRKQFIGKLLLQGSKCFHQLDPGPASFVLWSLGKLGKRVKDLSTPRLEMRNLISMLVSRMRRGVDQLSPRQLEASLRGLALLGHDRCREVLNPVVARLDANPEQFTTEQILSIFWSIVKLGGKCSHQMEKLIASGFLKYDEIKAQHLSMLLWSLAKSGAPNVGQCFPQILESVVSRKESFGPLYTGKILWSLSLFGYHPGNEFLEWVAKKIGKNHLRLSPEILSVGLNSFTNIGTLPLAFEEALKSHVSAHHERYQVSELCDLLWCLTIMGKLSQDIVDIAKARLCDLPANMLEYRNILKMAQVHIFLRLKPQPELSTDGLLTQEVEQECMSTWRGLQERKHLFAEASTALALLETIGFTDAKEKFMVEEVPLLLSTVSKFKDGEGSEKETYVVDLLFWPQKHGIYGMDLAMPARYRWRYQILNSLGYGVICVDVDVWRKMTSDDERQKYLEMNTYPPDTEPVLRLWGGISGSAGSTAQHAQTFKPEDVAENFEREDSDNVWDGHDEDDVFGDESVDSEENYGHCRRI